ncbi:nucleotidyltransferase family protein [Roseateles sp.]|uniref:nucleotidyltransferase family protein n=1 Tax=Roseateles sp. TaxID=1971397 RepID=UPI00394D3199
MTTKAHARIVLTDAELATVRSILDQHLPGIPVWVFGSRAKGTAKPYSDLDLALLAPQPLSLQALAEIREAFDSSDLPMRVDLLDWASTAPGFRQLIEADHWVIRP